MIYPIIIAGADPILPDGAIGANWGFLILAAIVGFFLWRFMGQVDSLVKQVAAIDKTQTEMKAQHQSMTQQLSEIKQEMDPQQVADIAVAKLLALSGGTGERLFPFKSKKKDE